MNSVREHIWRISSCLLAVVLLLPLTAELRLCVAADHLNLAATNATEACCGEGQTRAAEAGRAFAADSSECGACLDLNLPESDTLARMERTPVLLQLCALSIATSLIPPSAPVAAILPSRHQQAPLLPARTGTLLRI